MKRERNNTKKNNLLKYRNLVGTSEISTTTEKLYLKSNICDNEL